MSGANEHLNEEDVTFAKSLISSASVMVCQLEIDPEMTHLALSLAKSADSKCFNSRTIILKESSCFCVNT